MNFYKHHIGDYAAATSHLSWLEDMAYSRMLRAYYHHERPLPATEAEVFRLIRATTAAQKAAARKVLREFFVSRPEGYKQKRAEEELELANSQRDVNVLNAKKRWDAIRNAKAMPSLDAVAMPARLQTKDKEKKPTSSAVQQATDPSDPKAMIWKTGVSLLIKTGSSESSARTFLGQYAKNGCEARLAEVIGFLAASPKVEPKAYITAAMTKRRPGEVGEFTIGELAS